MNQQLDDFYSHLNEAVITTNDFEEGSQFRKREKVNQFAYCGLNPMYRHYLSFDLDEQGSAFKFEDVNLPAPTIITINKQNSHCHYLYHLKTPVAYHENSRSKPQEYFDAIQDAMTSCLNADQAFTHTLTKNPLHDRWQVITNKASYDLGDFLEYIDLPKHSPYKPLIKDMNCRGRNDQLFHTLRLWGYRAVHSFINEQTWRQEAQNKALEINNSFTSPLPYKEVRDTANTTSKWIWKNRHRLGGREKVLSFTNETAHERMSKGAEYTNAIRTKKTIQVIQDTVNEMLASGHTISPMSVQIRSGLNIKTIRKYLPKINLHPIKH
ncbi:replication initiation protein [Methylotenera sp. 1P/1]|uniref:replication initiation protein n=1 Tax=Methylotenera sp. 1P/1 TaxID=1131551 RepID=UPI00037FB4C3|nr:replication initiation protein [Methylotenera sp. 1P/1]